MTTIIQNVAVLDPAVLWSKKKSGTPISTAVPKQMSCRFVSPNMTLDFTFVRSFGTVTYAVCPAKLDHTSRCKSGHGNRQ